MGSHQSSIMKLTSTRTLIIFTIIAALAIGSVLSEPLGRRDTRAADKDKDSPRKDDESSVSANKGGDSKKIEKEDNKKEEEDSDKETSKDDEKDEDEETDNKTNDEGADDVVGDDKKDDD